MLEATIIVKVKIHPDSDREEAEKDCKEYERQSRHYWGDEVTVQYTVAEVTTRLPEKEHNHDGQIFTPDTCPACQDMAEAK